MDITHPAEVKVHRYLEDVTKGKRGMSEAVINQVASDVHEALTKQFANKKSRKEFTLRMSNVGRPACQLWFDKNDPDSATDFPINFLMNMMIGDIVEAVFKGILSEAGVVYKNGHQVTLEIEGHKINGTHDLLLDNKVDDIKSASPWSYKNKFKDFATLKEHDPFGYLGQLAGYAKALGVEAGGWWVINKANGEFKYVSAWDMVLHEELDKIVETANTVKANNFKRCFEPVEETFRKKPTGNKILGDQCGWCNYRYKCWPTLQERPSLVSQAKEPPMIPYVEISDEYETSK